MFSSRSAMASVSLTFEVESDSVNNVSVNTVFSFFDPLTGVCRKGSPYWSLNTALLCSLLVCLAQGSVSSWRAPVLLSSSLPGSSFNVRIAQMSVSDPLDTTVLLWGSQSKLNRGRVRILSSIGRAIPIAQLYKSVSHEGPYLIRALTINYCTN